MHKIYLKILLPCLLLLSHQACKSQGSEELLRIQYPTIEQEATSIWRTINDIEFLEKQAYQISLPEDKLIDSLILKSKNGAFGNADFSKIYNLLASGVYQKTDYEISLKKLEDEKALLERLLGELISHSKTWNWDFKLYPSYDIVLTLYGTGGGYDPETGRVTLFTNREGGFMKYKNPANTIIHEIIHLGIEKSIVQAYNVPHGSKERIVDTMVSLLFGEALPHYQIQNMGDPAIDHHLEEVAALKQLSSIVEKLF